MSELPPSGGVPTWDVADRMRKCLREANVGIQEMADYLGVARSTLGNWVGGRIEPSTQTLRLWAMRCGIDYEWLAYGAVDNHVAAARALSEPGLNNAGSTGSGGLILQLRSQVGPSAMRDAA
jgi:transcriptional regulator with XRE-family HTH domain